MKEQHNPPTPEELIVRVRELVKERGEMQTAVGIFRVEMEMGDLTPKLADALEAERAKVKVAREALEKAEEALQVLRSSHENRGDYFDGWATNALRYVTPALTKLDQ